MAKQKTSPKLSARDDPIVVALKEKITVLRERRKAVLAEILGLDRAGGNRKAKPGDFPQTDIKASAEALIDDKPRPAEISRPRLVELREEVEIIDEAIRIAQSRHTIEAARAFRAVFDQRGAEWAEVHRELALCFARIEGLFQKRQKLQSEMIYGAGDHLPLANIGTAERLSNTGSEAYRLAALCLRNEFVSNDDLRKETADAAS